VRGDAARKRDQAELRAAVPRTSSADLFQDQLDKARENFNKIQQEKGYAALDASQLFVGPNAWQQMAGSKEVDAIVIATPPYFHPQHLEAVVAARKHVYCEKPCVDVREL